MVAVLIERKYGIRLARNSVGRLLAQLGITPQKPLYRAVERDATLVQKWLKTEYPKIRAIAKTQGADIYFGDAAHIRSDHHAGRTWAGKARPRWSRPPVLAMRFCDQLERTHAVHGQADRWRECRCLYRVPQNELRVFASRSRGENSVGLNVAGLIAALRPMDFSDRTLCVRR
jgi:hypothetical protein